MLFLCADGHVLEFPQIRIDCFTQSTDAKPHYIPYPLPSPEDDVYSQAGPSKQKQKAPERSGVYRAPQAQYLLLTHAHTDHLHGLSNLHNNCTIICSENTKALLLNYERRKDRAEFDQAIKPILAQAAREHQDENWVHRRIKESGIQQKKVYQGLRAKEVDRGGTPVVVDCIVSVSARLT
jgi:glyoxylase-like metal-dependent hydrolase (beta-lactamase superfamily II)